MWQQATANIAAAITKSLLVIRFIFSVLREVAALSFSHT